MSSLSEAELPFLSYPVNPRAEYLEHPDYSRPRLEIGRERKAQLLRMLEILYGSGLAASTYPELERILQVHHAYKSPALTAQEAGFDPHERLTERDVIAITYGEIVSKSPRPPLEILHDLLLLFLRGVINTVHILPFFPYSSDRGFSVIDYKQVDPRLGAWREIRSMHRNFRLMFDGVVNHISAESEWFREFLNGNPDYADFFRSFETRDRLSSEHLKLIMRPRVSDVLTKYDTLNGTRWVWTTFSPDQIDLNYKNPQVLLRMLDVLLFYVRKGADLIRLDAATYLWEELGTTCAHLEQTHAIIRLFRAAFDEVAPHTVLITETNVPQEDNFSYFGDGTDEAHMVYNFSLPPVVLHTFLAGDCTRLNRWADKLKTPSDQTTILHMLDTHDGIGLLGGRGVLSDREIDNLVQTTIAHGGLVGYRTDRQGRQSPYELNIPWYQALNGFDPKDPIPLQVARYLASRSIALVLQGVPGVYLPAIVGSLERVTDHSLLDEPRSINRTLVTEERLFDRLTNPESAYHEVMVRFREMLSARVSHRAFHPNASQRVIESPSTVFALERIHPDTQTPVWCFTNVTAVALCFTLETRHTLWRDLLSARFFRAQNGVLRLSLEPYEVLWLEPARD
jgi:glucosylglycerate phosphorylase